MSEDEQLAEHLMEIRAAICAIEHILGAYQGDLKEFDKAVGVMKVGAKVMKRELSHRGFKQLGKQAKARVQ